jgi:hypothetical protein
MLAISAWTWVIAAAFAVISLAVLAKLTLGLLGRLKELNRSLQGASGQLNEILDEMRSDLDRASEGLSSLRQIREDAPDRP